MKTQTKFRGVLMLFLTALIWGTSFVAQSVGTDAGVEPFTYSCIRMLMGTAALSPVILIRSRLALRGLDSAGRDARRAVTKRTWLAGLPLGVVFALAANFQQFAFTDPAITSGKIAFITALYLFLVPLFGLFFGKRVSPIMWVCVAIGFGGLYVLCVGPAGFGGIGYGDLLSLLCSVFFAIQILLIEHYASSTDGVLLSAVQFLVAGGLSGILMLIFETPRIEVIGAAMLPLLYSGLMSCGIAYTFQIIGQKYTDSTVASLIMCMESVFAVLSAAVVLREIPEVHETIGCIIMFAAILLSQLADRIPLPGKKIR